MSNLDVSPPDYGVLDGTDDFLEDYPTEPVVRWYERPGWPFGKTPPAVVVAGAFALGLVAGVAFTAGAVWARDRD
jgi:hypothetical protein